MSFDEAARQMALAYRNFLNPPKKISWTFASQRQVDVRKFKNHLPASLSSFP